MNTTMEVVEQALIEYERQVLGCGCCAISYPEEVGGGADARVALLALYAAMLERIKGLEAA